MAKRFFYLSMGILALAGAYHLGARSTEAFSGGGPIAFVSAQHPEYIWDNSGECWRREFGEGTEYNQDNQDLFNMPFPPASVVDHVPSSDKDVFVLDTGVIWQFKSGGSDDWWTVVGTFSSPVSTDAQSFGSVKGMFR